MPRSRSRKGRKPYRPPTDIPPALAAKQARDYSSESQKWGLPIIGGEGPWDMSVTMRFRREDETTVPADPSQLPRKHRLYGLKKGLLEYDENGNLREVTK
jgi:hypothetical protein